MAFLHAVSMWPQRERRTRAPAPSSNAFRWDRGECECLRRDIGKTWRHSAESIFLCTSLRASPVPPALLHPQPLPGGGQLWGLRESRTSPGQRAWHSSFWKHIQTNTTTEWLNLRMWDNRSRPSWQTLPGIFTVCRESHAISLVMKSITDHSQHVEIHVQCLQTQDWAGCRQWPLLPNRQTALRNAGNGTDQLDHVCKKSAWSALHSYWVGSPGNPFSARREVWTWDWESSKKHSESFITAFLAKCLGGYTQQLCPWGHTDSLCYKLLQIRIYWNRIKWQPRNEGSTDEDPEVLWRLLTFIKVNTEIYWPPKVNIDGGSGGQYLPQGKINLPSDPQTEICIQETRFQNELAVT